MTLHLPRLVVGLTAVVVLATSQVAGATPAPGKPELGIRNDHQGPFNCCKVLIENSWGAFRRSLYVQVFAGGIATSYKADFTPKTTRGVVVEVRMPWPSTHELPRMLRLTPRTVKSLRIIAARRNTLTLVSPSGRRFSYSVKTHALIAARD